MADQPTDKTPTEAEPPAEPVAETTTLPAAEPKVEVVADSAVAPAEPADEPEQPAKPQKTEWQRDRINTLTARLKAAQAKIAQLESTPSPEGSTAIPAVDFERQVQTVAERRAQEMEFNRQCNDLVNAGKAQFDDFDSRVTSLRDLVDFTDKDSASHYVTLVQTALETGEGHKVLYALGGDQDRANQMLKMSPVKMAIEMAKLVAPTGQTVSSAPNPIKPVGPKGPTLEPIDPTTVAGDRLSTREWMNRREAQARERGLQ